MAQKKEWNTLNEQLKETLQKEVNIMRELLANMHQEELSRLLNDQGSLQQLLQQRSVIVDRLGSLRKNRLDTSDRIEKITDKDQPVDDEMSTEILSLRDQLFALTEQMNRQQSQNQYLIEHPEHIQTLAEQTLPRPKRKASVATYQIKSNNGRNQ